MSEGRAQLRVLVVDDTATNRQILQVFLRKLGFAVIMAENGAQAVEKFQSEAPDLILMDVMMPVMDGYEATRRIKRISQRWIPIVFLSALDKEEDLVAGLDAGGDDYLAKPVNFVILDAKLRSLMRSIELQHQVDDQAKRISAITDNIVDCVLSIDEKGIIRWCNPAVEHVFGYGHDELIGSNISMLMPAPYREEHDGHLERYRSGGAARVIGQGQRLVRGNRRNGEEFPLELGVSEMVVAGSRQFVGILRDVSDRLRAEQVLKENATRLQEYHDVQEAESQLAQDIVMRQMMRAELADPSVHHWVVPAANFSGDIVAATRGPTGELYVLLADATGHGLGAAICTLPVLSVFYSMAEMGVQLPWIIIELNRQLKATMPIGRFVAATILSIDPKRHEAQIWVGGTPEVLHLGADGVVKASFPSEHLALGIDTLDEAEATPIRVAIGPQEQFVMFSDGLPEACSPDDKEFGLEAMASALASVPREQRMQAVQDALLRHVGTGSPHDDVSLLLIDCA